MNKAVDHVVALLAIIFAILLSIVENLIDLLTPKSAKRKSIKGKVALITGGGSGVGRGVAIRLAECGARIIVWDVNGKGNEETKQLITRKGHHCDAFTVNLCDRSAIYKVAAEVKKRYTKVDILFNNAGVITGKSFIDCPDECIQRTFDVNVLSYMFTTKAFLPEMMKDNSGHIINMGSVASFSGVKKQSDYSASKFALLGFHETFSEELHGDGYNGISTTFVAPFYIDTGMFKGSSSGILEFLKVEDVCDEIVEAIITRKTELILPWHLSQLIFMKRWFTPRGKRIVARACGILDTMDTFVGRNNIGDKEI